MKCVCKDPSCITGVKFDALSRAMIIEQGDSNILIYLDPNAIVELIAELRRCLTAMVNGDVAV